MIAKTALCVRFFSYFSKRRRPGRTTRPPPFLAILHKQWTSFLCIGSSNSVPPFGSEAAREYGDIREDLSRKGTIIGGNDLLIAAHARAEGLILVTNNAREFERVAGLRVENWV